MLCFYHRDEGSEHALNRRRQLLAALLEERLHCVKARAFALRSQRRRPSHDIVKSSHDHLSTSPSPFLQARVQKKRVRDKSSRSWGQRLGSLRPSSNS